ncbi:hypothetical protein ONE63_001678 [Megalurothrips usitatus]|uniref:Endonuclease/exonuclease/phosphatase domain-containing protein n=1 Tax=Megalurothrips usitatus TaxID=439358 RepID=A0AAV7XGA9_9NEOP|nr:hypothetical protein ONE63_001678 [Megalurothrips usitatus]
MSWKKTDKSTWKCPQCRKLKTSNEQPVSPEEMRKFMRSVSDFMKSANEKLESMDELKQSVQFIREQYDELIKQVKQVEAEREAQRTQIAGLEEQVNKRDDDIKSLRRRLRDTEQYARNRNVEVTGVEVVAGEDMRKVMANIAENINVPFQEGDIDVIFAIPEGCWTPENCCTVLYPVDSEQMAEAEEPWRGDTEPSSSARRDQQHQEFCDTFSNSAIDVIGVSETFYKESSHMCVPNYNVYHVNSVNRGGGGVALYVHNRIKSRLIAKSDGDILKPEYVIVEIQCANETILVSCIYRPPKVEFLEYYLDDLYKLLPSYKYSVICGDLNARFGSGSYETKLVCELLDRCDHASVPFDATYKLNNCKSILDVIASNSNDHVIEYGQCVAPGFSAHYMLHCVLDLRVKAVKSKIIKFKDFKRINKVALVEDAKNTP